MISNSFTLLELTDLALKVPELGAVNFNMLHTVLTRLIIEVGLDGVRTPCHIENETLAQTAITKARLEDSHLRRLSKVPTVKEMKDRIKILEDKPTPEGKAGSGADSKPEQDELTEKKEYAPEEPEKRDAESAKVEEKVADTSFEDSAEAVDTEDTSVEDHAKTQEKVEDTSFEESAKADDEVEDASIEESAKTDLKLGDVSVEESATAEAEGEDVSVVESAKAETKVEESTKAEAEEKDPSVVESVKDETKVEDLSVEVSAKAEAEEEDPSVVESVKEEQKVDDLSFEESAKAGAKGEDAFIVESAKDEAKEEDSPVEESAKTAEARIDGAEAEARIEDESVEEHKRAAKRVDDSSIEESKGEAEKCEDMSIEESAAAEKKVEKISIQETPKAGEKVKDVTTTESALAEKDTSSEESAEDIEKTKDASSVVKVKSKVQEKVGKDTVTEESSETLEDISVEEKIERIVEKLAEMTTETPTEGEELKEGVEDPEASEMTIQEMQETARDLMEKSADIVIEQVAVVTDALKILEDEELLDAEPAKVMEELWRATNINRRMEAAEEGLRELSAIMDAMLDKVQDLEDASQDVLTKTRAMIQEISTFLRRIEVLEETSKTINSRIDDSNEQRAFEVERLEGIINELTRDHQDTKSALVDMEAAHHDLAERVAYKEDLENLKSYMAEALDTRVKEMKKLIREVEDTLVKKEDFMEMVTRIEELEVSKVSREELGRLLEPGFIDSFLNEQENLRTELEELKITGAELRDDFDVLKTRIDENIVKTMENNFAEINGMLDKINEKLALLDPDEINDSFANLEEQAAMIIQELDDLKTTYEQFQKEAKINFNKISNFNDLLSKLDQTKADKIKMYELLEMKADIDMLLNKLDRREFVEVVGEMKENLERLTITVKINEEEMSLGFSNVRHELSLKMYTEDFITATEPIRNRIKALMYELERVKQIALTHLFPDAPGIAKCISCKRGANLAGAKYLGDATVDMLQEVPPPASVTQRSTRTSKPFSSTVSVQESSDVRLPPIDLDSVPIPPPDHPRQKDAGRLPLLFAKARPQVGLAHEMRRRDIDKKLAAYFASRPVRPCGGGYTRTAPQQRGLDFTTVTLPQVEKEEVLLPGIDKGIYRGTVYGGRTEDSPAEAAPAGKKEDETTKKIPDIASLKPPRAKKGFIRPDLRSRSKQSDNRNTVMPSVVSLHVDDEPLQKTTQLTKSSLNLPLPSGPMTKEKKFPLEQM